MIETAQKWTADNWSGCFGGAYIGASLFNDNAAQVTFAKHHDVINAFLRIEPINRFAYEFCQGERAEVK
jgi:hypothetical protein